MALSVSSLCATKIQLSEKKAKFLLPYVTFEEWQKLKSLHNSYTELQKRYILPSVPCSGLFEMCSHREEKDVNYLGIVISKDLHFDKCCLLNFVYSASKCSSTLALCNDSQLQISKASLKVNETPSNIKKNIYADIKRIGHYYMWPKYSFSEDLSEKKMHFDCSHKGDTASSKSLPSLGPNTLRNCLSVSENNDDLYLSEDKERSSNSFDESYVTVDELSDSENYCSQTEDDEACDKDYNTARTSDTLESVHMNTCQGSNQGDGSEMVKTYMIPFKSQSKQENKDNKDPKWRLYKELRTFEERYQYARLRWRSMVIPDPYVNMTTFSYKWKTKASEHILDSSKSVSGLRKRTLTSKEQLVGRPPNKRARRISIDFAHQYFDDSIRQAESKRNSKTYRGKCVSALNKNQLERIEMLKMAKLEISAMHDFYEGLPYEDRNVSQNQIEDCLYDFYEMCNRFKHIYQWNGSFS